MPRYDDRYGGTRLYVGRLSSKTRSRDLEYMFGKYGKVREVELKRDYAFIEFGDSRDADDARHSLNNRDVDGSRILVEFARGGSRSSGGGGGGGGGGSRDYAGRGPPPGTGRCFNCGIEGHWARDCQAGDWKNKCYRCGERGHVERNCQNSPKKLRRGRSYSPRRGRSRSRSFSRSRSDSQSRSPRREGRGAARERSRSLSDSRSPSRSPPPRSSRKRSPSPPAKTRKRSPSPDRSPRKRSYSPDRSPPAKARKRSPTPDRSRSRSPVEVVKSPPPAAAGRDDNGNSNNGSSPRRSRSPSEGDRYSPVVATNGFAPSARDDEDAAGNGGAGSE